MLQLLQPADLVDLHTAVFLAPPVIGLFADAKLTRDLADRLALRYTNLCLTEMSDDLLRCVSLPGHSAPFLCSDILTLGMGTIQGGRSESEEDLDGVAYALFEEFDNLGFGLYRATTIIADRETMKRRAWFALTGLVGGDLDGVETVYANRWVDLAAIAASNPPQKIRHDAWIAGKERYQREQVETGPFREIAEGEGFKRERPDLVAAIDWDRFPPSWHQCTLYHKNGWLTLVSKEKLDDDNVAIGLRFADLFEFAYDRFKELDAKQKANRELAVEAALERVRGQALAMEDEAHLTGISQAIFEELEGLNYDLRRSVITIGAGDLVKNWATLRDGGAVRSGHSARRLDGGMREAVPALARESQQRQKARADGQAYHVLALTEREARDRIEAMNRFDPQADNLPQTLPQGSEHHHSLFISKGNLSLITASALDEAEIDIGIRFAKLFEFAYDRFLELDAKQKANHELAVEAALERVRGQALAMESEEDLNGVAYALFEEFDGLGFDLVRATTVVFDLGEKTARSWSAFTGSVDETLQGVESVWARPKYSIEGWFSGEGGGEDQERFDAWQSGERYLQQFRDDVSEMIESAREILKAERPDLESAYNWDNHPQSEHLCTLFNAHGLITIVTEEELDEEMISIGLRFSDLFSFAYDRFSELDAKQKANRELAVEAALERVRGKALAMESEENLTGVAISIAES